MRMKIKYLMSSALFLLCRMSACIVYILLLFLISFAFYLRIKYTSFKILCGFIIYVHINYILYYYNYRYVKVSGNVWLWFSVYFVVVIQPSSKETFNTNIHILQFY